MAKKWKITALFFFLAMAGAGLFWLLKPESDSVKIKKVLRELAASASKPAGENPAFSALKLRNMHDIFGDKCRFDFRVGSFNGELNPTEIASNLARAKALFRSAEVKAGEIRISFAGADEADVLFSGSFQARGKDGGGDVSEVRDVNAGLRRSGDGRWKIVSMSFHEVLEK